MKPHEFQAEIADPDWPDWCHEPGCGKPADDPAHAAEVDTLLHHEYVYVGMNRDGTELILACGRCGQPRESIVHRVTQSDD